MPTHRTLTRLKTPEYNPEGRISDLWVLIHHHRHGQDVYPLRARTEEDLPDPEHYLGSEVFESQYEDEWCEWCGPFTVDPDTPTDPAADSADRFMGCGGSPDEQEAN